VPGRSREDELNLDVMDAISELVKRATTLGQEIAQRMGLSVTDVIGLHKLEEPLTMKELGQRLHCDPSFVTMIANGLERHGLAKRETCEHDRRIKTVTLTAEGAAMKERLEQEIAERMPWAHTLDVHERRCLLTIVRKMLGHPQPGQSGRGQPDQGRVTADEAATLGGERTQL
jgi:MarR family transcriptional regulator, organic hydroperoxide resistance regulator